MERSELAEVIKRAGARAASSKQTREGSYGRRVAEIDRLNRFRRDESCCCRGLTPATPSPTSFVDSSPVKSGPPSQIYVSRSVDGRRRSNSQRDQIRRKGETPPPDGQSGPDRHQGARVSSRRPTDATRGRLVGYCSSSGGFQNEKRSKSVFQSFGVSCKILYSTLRQHCKTK